ncbi:hypothetical protein PoB_004135700 [Plakobranchus ocellatus]|uniref:Uncharacterized protein n=1 Tax=Plakobranchus ocellatus TaxID=259542 RepID=A0AAV4B6X7_9GAST|nr:hypothetical protein PoB_004135700 [Plakobranchus ocellatus]
MSSWVSDDAKRGPNRADFAEFQRLLGWFVPSLSRQFAYPYCHCGSRTDNPSVLLIPFRKGDNGSFHYKLVPPLPGPEYWLKEIKDL